MQRATYLQMQMCHNDWPSNRWFEKKQFDAKCTITNTNIVEQKWLSRYLWPTQITYDRGKEFIGHEFQHMVKHDYGIKPEPISVRNLQANAIVKSIHQVIANMIQTFELGTSYLDIEDP